MKKISLLLVLPIAAMLVVSCSTESDNASDQNNSTSRLSAQTAQKPAQTEITKPAVPQFAAYDIDGKMHQSSEWIGKRPVVINFWGTWCGPCRREIPDMVQLYDEYQKKGVEILGLAVKDTPDRVRAYSGNAGMKWPLLMAKDQIMIDYRALRGVPTTIFINREGQEVARYVGMRDYTALKLGFDAIL
jgi:thiol-disulfide isomerase/thioredoxin